MAPSVLIIGGSGAVGRPLVDEFLKQKSKFQRIAVLADPAKSSWASFLDAKSYTGFDVVVSLAGNAAMRLQPGMIEAAIAGGVRHFYPSEYGGDISVGDFWKNSYTLLMTGPFTEYAVSSFNGIDFEKHTVEPYGKPGAELSVTAMADVMRYIVESILIPFDSSKNVRELRVPGEAHTTWEKLMEYLGEVQGVEYKIAYLDPREAALKQEEARKGGNEDEEVFWAGKSVMLNGSGLIPEPLDKGKFSFTPETAKETIQRLFGKK
ncbi:hypothetical protein DFH09DRAFT_1210809 [Mycena vulgaris]|nr:hypothetical protein DFH09DRAFT_1210809 [Mycena vulgaris]